jgi:tetratricopeptide (TPR) repeat protein
MLFVSLSCSPGSHVGRGDSYFTKARYRDALAEYLAERKTDRTSHELLFKIGLSATRLGDLGMARAYYDTLLASDPSRKEWIVSDLFQWGLKNGAEGDPASMRESFQIILDIDSTYNLGKSFYPLARAYREAGQYDRAARAYLKGLAFSPDSPEATPALLELAECYEKLGKYREATAYYEEYLSHYAGERQAEVLWHFGNAAYRLAEELYEKRNFDEALEYLQMVIDAGEPQVLQGEAWFLAGEIRYTKGEFEEALHAYQEVVRLDNARTMKVAEKSRERIREIRYGKAR